MKTCYSKTINRAVRTSSFIFTKAVYTPGCQLSFALTVNTLVPFLRVSFLVITDLPCISKNRIFAWASTGEVIAIWNWLRTGLGAIVIPVFVDGLILTLNTRL